MMVNLKGEIDHHTSQLVKIQIDDLSRKKGIKKILFNFKNVTFMDSSGVGMIIGCYKAMKKIGGTVGAYYINDRIKKIFEMSGIFNILDYYNDEKEALEKK